MASRKTIDCPVCGSPMQKRMVNADVQVDYCDWHGVWLDAGALERLQPVQPAPRRAHPPPPPVPDQGRGRGIGKAVAQGVAGAAVMGAGFHLGGRLVGGLIDGLFRRG